MRPTMISLGIAAMLLSGASHVVGQVPERATTQKEERIRELMRLTGSADMGLQVMQQMLASFRQAMPEVPNEFWDRFMAEIDPDDLVNLVVPVYDRHFSEDDVDKLIEFYNTPVGQKVISTMPSILQESMVLGQQWGEGLAQKIAAQLEKEGYRR